jgi:hypothetical protein
MKVKINDTVYDANEVPIMLILSDQDKFNITHMAPEADRYAAYPDSLEWSREQVSDWMDEGYEPDSD